jgi:ribosomal protein S18 acetylase RimI-like enzyme
MKIDRFTTITNSTRLSKIIFLNFINLENEPGISFSIDDIYSTLIDPNLLGWFLMDNDNKIIGYLIGTRKELGDGRLVYYISYFYIIQKYRNKKLGKEMLLTCMRYIASINIKFIMLISDVNSNAFTLYRNIGFVYEPIMKLENPNFTILLYYN